MTYRPSDWSPLAASDPVPGDPDEVARLADEYRDTALEIEKQSRVLRALSATEGWDSDAGEVFAAEAKELAGKLGKAHGRYAAVSTQLRRWAPALREAQRTADRALADAQEAEARQRASSRSLLVGVDDPSPELAAAERRRMAVVEEAAGAIAAARRRLDHAVDLLDRTAEQVANAIEHASDDDLKDGMWDKVKGIVKDHAKVIHTIAEIISAAATVLAIVALVLAAPLTAWVVALTAVAFLLKATLAALGETTWLDAGLEAFQLATLGVGRVFVRGAKLGTALTRGAAARRSGAEAAAAVRARHRTSLGVSRWALRTWLPLGPLRGKAAAHATRVKDAAEVARAHAERLVWRTPLAPSTLATRLRYLDDEVARYAMDARKMSITYRSPEVLANARRVEDAARRFRNVTGVGLGVDLADKMNLIPGTKPHFTRVSGRCGG